MMAALTNIEPKKKPRILISFVRAQITAMLATTVDFGVMIGLKELLGMWYLLAVTIGTMAGGIIGFLLGRNWAFISKETKPIHQVQKYFIVMAGSFVLNVGGVYLLVENTHLQYIISKIIVAIIVGIGFNFLLQRYYVFK